MSVSITTNKSSKAISVGNLSKAFGQITLSSEVKEFLSGLDAELVVTYSGGSTTPNISIRARDGKLVCSIADFQKLGGFRRWVSDELKALDKEQASEEKIVLLGYFLREAAGTPSIAIGTRMLDANEQKFRSYYSMVGVIDLNIECLEQGIDNDSKAYLLKKAKALKMILYRFMLLSVQDKKIDKDEYATALFENGIPKWIAAKLVDKQFASSMKSDATMLLFPKVNYLKSVSFTTKEMKDETFLSANKEILAESGSIIYFAKCDWKDVLPTVPDASKDEYNKFYEELPWILNNPYEIEEILEIRVAGKTPPLFRPRQVPRAKPGQKSRPETETQRLCRETYNFLGQIVSTWLGFQNLVVICDDPLTNFWSKILTGTDTWEITPMNGLMKHIADSKQPLDEVRDLSKQALLDLMAEIIVIDLEIPLSSAKANLILSKIRINRAAAYVQRSAVAKVLKPAYATDLSVLMKTELDEQDLDKAKTFLGQKKKKKSSGKPAKKTNAATIRLETGVLDELSMIEDHSIYDKVKEWISTFKTGRKKAVQILAAELVAGEVLKYKDKILGEDFNEYEFLQAMEEDEDDYAY